LSFKQVHLEGSFVASEFSATSTSNVNVNLVGSSVGFGLRLPSFGASAVNMNTDTQTAQTQDVSVATMSMTARILPKPVKALTKPPLIFKGPTLALTIISRPVPVVMHPLPAPPPATDPPYLEIRSMGLQIQLKDVNDAVNTTTQDKTIAIDCGTLDWGVTTAGGSPATTGPKTDANGQFFIMVSRAATSSTDPKIDYVIRASLNLVNATLNISL
jgi:hypothetical protein